MEYIKRSRRGTRKNSATKTLLFGVLAGSVLAGAGSFQVSAEEIDVKLREVKSSEGEQVKELSEEELKENAEKLIKEIQEGKNDTFLALSGTILGNEIPEDVGSRVSGAIGYQEVDEEDTETVKRLKEEQKGLSTLIDKKYEDAKALSGVVKGVRDGNIGTGSISKQVAIREGENRIDGVLSELDTLVEVKELIDEDLEDAKGIQGEIKEIEEEIKARLAEILGEDFDADTFDLTGVGDLSLSGDYLEYLNSVEGGNNTYNVRSSFVQQTTKDSKVLASYYGQNKQLDALIAEGLQYLHLPYVWGGESVVEGGFDCSGLMYRIFKDTLGINLPRVSQAQQNFGQRIPLDSIQPGDLVFWNSPATHVALYLGNGKILEAANPTAGLRVRDVRLSELSSATRVHDFGISDNVKVNITNAKKTISYTPVLSREQSQSYNQSVQNTQDVSQAEIDAEVRRIEQQAQEEKARLAEQQAQERKQEEERKAKEEKEKQQAESNKKQEEAKKKEQEAKQKEEEQRKAEEQQKGEEQRKAEEERKAEEARKQAELEKQQAEEEARKQREIEESNKQEEVSTFSVTQPVEEDETEG